MKSDRINWRGIFFAPFAKPKDIFKAIWAFIGAAIVYVIGGPWYALGTGAFVFFGFFVAEIVPAGWTERLRVRSSREASRRADHEARLARSYDASLEAARAAIAALHQDANTMDERSQNLQAEFAQMFMAYRVREDIAAVMGKAELLVNEVPGENVLAELANQPFVRVSEYAGEYPSLLECVKAPAQVPHGGAHLLHQLRQMADKVSATAPANPALVANGNTSYLVQRIREQIPAVYAALAQGPTAEMVAVLHQPRPSRNRKKS